jgi:hypothetical protein
MMISTKRMCKELLTDFSLAQVAEKFFVTILLK